MPNYKKSRKHVVKTTLKPVQKQTGPNYVFTSESVSAGHPDKICDQISDMILDMYLEKDPEAKVACETMVTKNRIVVAGEINSKTLISKSEIKQAVYKKINEIGYYSKGWWPIYDNDYCKGPSLWKRMINRKIPVNIDLHQQSKEINQGVSTGEDQGAGDQGIMFGYACGSEKTNYMPEAIYYSHRVMETINELRLKKFPNLGPDAKCQLSIKYQNGLPVGVTSIVLSTQHVEGSDPSKNQNIENAIVKLLLSNNSSWQITNDNRHINPSGSFITGGPVADVGLTGRKIIVDTYGGYAPHGGGAFSGKDPSKVDRSAAYAARYLAKNIVAAGLAARCTIQLSYAIGVAQPQSIYVNMHGTETDLFKQNWCTVSMLEQALLDFQNYGIMDLRPAGIIKHLGLKNPIYSDTAVYGHFGRKPVKMGKFWKFSWERIDLVSKLQAGVSKPEPKRTGTK